jgi:hypothetical protein
MRAVPMPHALPNIAAPRMGPHVALPRGGPAVSVPRFTSLLPGLAPQQFARPLNLPATAPHALRPQLVTGPVHPKFLTRHPGIPALALARGGFSHSGLGAKFDHTPHGMQHVFRWAKPPAGRNLGPPLFAHKTGWHGFAPATFKGRFAHGFGWRHHHGHHRRSKIFVVGWIGPLFWPYAYTDFVDYTFYPYVYDAFWPSAHREVHDGILGRYGQDVRSAHAAVVRKRSPRATASGTDLCSGTTAALTNWPISEIAQTVEPDAAQRAALDALRHATAKALDMLAAACPAALPGTPTGRMEAMHTRLSAMLLAVKTVREPLAIFYRSLTDEQKARFNALGEDQVRRDLGCGGRTVGSLPIGRIERAVRPDQIQRLALRELQDAMLEAADRLKSDCPIGAFTPVMRLEAMEQRLDAMLRAVQKVQPALERFYDSLSNEQKARFNRLSPRTG